ncbi:MAG: diadenylate cyclase CdaA [Anaerolineae bacterium]|nr:diadenylate cyclase CdaA [Anaerolineae bacterium]
MSNLFYNLSRLDFSSAIDIFLVALVFYWILTLIQGTQAEQLLRGILILSVLAAIAASALNTLTAFSWLIDKALPALLVAIPVVFQPELRRALERLGRTSKIFSSSHQYSQVEQSIEAVGKAVLSMSRVKHGALIVFERNTGLEDHIETGVRLDALVTSDLLRTIFSPGTTLHDGAVIIRNNRIVAASVILPLGQATNVTTQLLGTRHLAALGISGMTDAVVIVVSEETGIISIAHNGQLIRGLDQAGLEQMLQALYQTDGVTASVWRRLKQNILVGLGLGKSTETASQVQSRSE